MYLYPWSMVSALLNDVLALLVRPAVRSQMALLDGQYFKRVDSIPTLHLKTFERFWTTT